MRDQRFWVYILTNKARTVLYIGVTNDVARRVYEHREKFVDGFTKRYNLDRLVHVEEFATAIEAIEREKEIKKWSRKKKLELIRQDNPKLEDMYPKLL